ncbi:MAG: DNA mismatch repair protein MutT, partial [Deltaproteobacteria bacterium HGW-Deltaproteobacteria-20]
MPRSALSILREMGRHVLRHPVVGVMAIARDEDGKYLMIRRADTGTWSMPGGTLEWGETVRDALVREVREESGARVLEVGRLVGVYA